MDEFLKRVPKKLHDRYREIVALTDAFCAARWNDELRDLCRACAADACKAKVPVTSGKVAGWAAGVVYSVGYANFLGSDSSQEFHTPPDDMAKGVGVSVATMHNKAKAIRDALDIDRADPRYCTRKMNDNNPLQWILSVNGFLMDIRQAPRGAQVEAFRKGLIPYIPADGPPTEGAASAPPPPKKSPAKKKKSAKLAGPPRFYTLDVFLIGGPLTKAFLKKNKEVSRTIEVRGDQTLEDLHWAIYDAFDRDDPHMYEFRFGDGPDDPKAPRYVIPEAADDGIDPAPAGLTTETTLDELGLEVGLQFGYFFDFGDNWEHQISVEKTADAVPKGKFPRITNRVGDSPPQYADEDDE